MSYNSIINPMCFNKAMSQMIFGIKQEGVAN